jgi:hypothetical protein
MKISEVTPIFTHMLTMHHSVRERMVSYCCHVSDLDPKSLDDAGLTAAYLRGFASITTQPEGEITEKQVSEGLGHLAGWV